MRYDWEEFAKSRAMRAMRAIVVYVPASQKRANFSFLRVNVPINVPTCQRAKGVPIIQLGVSRSQRRANLSTSLTKMHISFSKEFLFLNFSIMLNICKFLEYLGNCRKFISRNKECKFWHLQNFIKEIPYQPKTFKVVFNKARRFNHGTTTELLFG